MPENNELTKEQKIAIINQEIEFWKRSSFQMSLRVKVAIKISDKQMEESAKAEMIKYEAAIELLKEEITKL